MFRTAVLIMMCILPAACSRAEQEKSQDGGCTVPVCKKADPEAGDKASVPRDAPAPKTVDEVLARLKQKTSELKTYSCDLKYLFIQDPELLDSRTLRTGKLYYAKDDRDKKRSRVRIDFDTTKQDDEKQIAYKELFIFDGVWLVRIDYPLKKADYHQKAPADKPVDVFGFIGESFPIIGFTKVEDLRKQFEIIYDKSRLDDAKSPLRLKLKVRKGSKYKDDYKSVDFQLDRKTFLPVRIITESTEDDVYDIQFLNAIANKKLQNGVFKVEPPANFSKNKHPLE